MPGLPCQDFSCGFSKNPVTSSCGGAHWARSGSSPNNRPLSRGYFYLMDRLEPCFNDRGHGAEGNAALAAHFNDDIAASDAINEAGGDDLAANGHAVEGHSVAFFGGGDHCEVRHFFFNASGQLRDGPASNRDACYRDVNRRAVYFNAVTFAIGDAVAHNRGTVRGLELAGVDACGGREGENRCHAVAVVNLGLGVDSGEVCAAIIADNLANHEGFEQLAHGSGAFARDNVRLAGDGGEAGGEVLKAVNHWSVPLFDDLNIRIVTTDCNPFFHFFLIILSL